MLCHVTENRGGRPLARRDVVTSLIGAATTKGGSTIQSGLDGKCRERGRSVTGGSRK